MTPIFGKQFCLTSVLNLMFFVDFIVLKEAKNTIRKNNL